MGDNGWFITFWVLYGLGFTYFFYIACNSNTVAEHACDGELPRGDRWKSILLKVGAFLWPLMPLFLIAASIAMHRMRSFDPMRQADHNGGVYKPTEQNEEEWGGKCFRDGMDIEECMHCGETHEEVRPYFILNKHIPHDGVWLCPDSGQPVRFTIDDEHIKVIVDG